MTVNRFSGLLAALSSDCGWTVALKSIAMAGRKSTSTLHLFNWTPEVPEALQGGAESARSIEVSLALINSSPWRVYPVGCLVRRLRRACDKVSLLPSN
jgi:hypothetical protein